MQLIVFDLDGTLLNTLADLAAALNHALRNNGLPLRTVAEVRSFVGNGIRKLMERGVPAGTPAAVLNAVHADFTAFYEVHCADASAPYAGVLPLLDRLRAAGYKTAVISNKADHAVQKLVNAFFPGGFDFVLGETPPMRRKPAPDMVYAALAALNVPKEEALFVGDSEVDIETAQNAGLPCVSVTWGFKDRDFLLSHGAAVLLDAPEELTERMIRSFEI